MACLCGWRACVGGMLTWVACLCGLHASWVAWVTSLRWWRASVGGVLLLLLLLLLKYYPEDKNVEFLLLKQKRKNVPKSFEQ